MIAAILLWNLVFATLFVAFGCIAAHAGQRERRRELDPREPLERMIDREARRSRVLALRAAGERYETMRIGRVDYIVGEISEAVKQLGIDQSFVKQLEQGLDR